MRIELTNGMIVDRFTLNKDMLSSIAYIKKLYPSSSIEVSQNLIKVNIEN